MRKIALIFVILAMTAPMTLGKTLYVDSDYSGSDSSYFTSIQGAWDAAVDNDTIDIYAGIYEMCNLNNVSKNGVLMKAHATGDEMLYEHVVVYDFGTNNMYLRGPDQMTFEGLICRAKGDYYETGNDYCFYVRSPFCMDLTFDHCIFTGAHSYGVYMYYSGSDTTFDHCSFIGNTHGLRTYTSADLKNGKITNCLFYDNHAWVPDAWDGSGGYTPAHWTGYAASLRATHDAFNDDVIMQNCVVYASYNDSGPRTDGLNSITDDAIAGTGCFFNQSKPVMLSTNVNSDWFGYLSTNNYQVLTGSDTGGYVGARPALGVPEPATISLLALGLLAIRRRRK